MKKVVQFLDSLSQEDLMRLADKLGIEIETPQQRLAELRSLGIPIIMPSLN